jgi:hypothetical protein
MAGSLSMLFDNKGFSDNRDEIGESKGRKLMIVTLLLLCAALFIFAYYEYATSWLGGNKSIGIGLGKERWPRVGSAIGGSYDHIGTRNRERFRAGQSNRPFEKCHPG